MLNRRSVLKKGTGIGITSLAQTGLVGATKNGSAGATKYVGFTYDPKTRELYGPASALINQNNGKLDGVYKFRNTDGFFPVKKKQVTIPVKSQGEDKIQKAISGYQNSQVHNVKVGGDLAKRARLANGSVRTFPLEIESHVSKNLTGRATYPNNIGEIGFVMNPVSKMKTENGVRGNVKNALVSEQVSLTKNFEVDK